MKKVFLIHGFQGSPNGGWRPWLMAELEKLNIYACALAMPNPEDPICSEWVEEIARHVEQNNTDDIYLVGHSLGVPAILRYLEISNFQITGAVLVSGPIQSVANKKIEYFLDKPFDFVAIRPKVKHFVVIHGDNDTNVPVRHAETLSRELGVGLIVVPNGRHLNGSSGFTALPECLTALNNMFEVKES